MYLSSRLAQMVTLLTCTHGYSFQIFAGQSYFLTWAPLWFSSIYPYKCNDRTLKQTTAFFILNYSLHIDATSSLQLIYHREIPTRPICLFSNVSGTELLQRIWSLKSHFLPQSGLFLQFPGFTQSWECSVFYLFGVQPMVEAPDLANWHISGSSGWMLSWFWVGIAKLKENNLK